MHGSPPSRGIPGHPLPLTARGNDQLMIVHHETDRADFLTRLGQEIPSPRWRSATLSHDPAVQRSGLTAEHT